jgi:hypothetical protein
MLTNAQNWDADSLYLVMAMEMAINKLPWRSANIRAEEVEEEVRQRFREHREEVIAEVRKHYSMDLMEAGRAKREEEATKRYEELLAAEARGEAPPPRPPAMSAYSRGEDPEELEDW